MAHQRIHVARSPFLVWLGVIVIVCAFGMMRAGRGSVTPPRTPGDVGWIVIYLLGALSIVRGLTGAWFGQLRIDLAGRTVQTVAGAIIPFDRIGPLTIEWPLLKAPGVEVHSDRSALELERMRDALEHALGRSAGKPRVHRPRRLAIDRSPLLFVFTLIGFASILGVTFGNIIYGSSDELEYKLLALVGLAICFAWFRRALFGSRSSNQLFVDIPAGLLQHADGRVRPFSELGALSVTKRVERRDYSRHTMIYFELHAANLKPVLFSDLYESCTQRRFRALSIAMLAHELRRVFELAPDDASDAFRSGPSLAAEVDRVAGDSPFRARALAALSTDPDQEIRRRVTNHVTKGERAIANRT